MMAATMGSGAQLLVLAALAACAASCKVGPDFHPPALPLPAQFKSPADAAGDQLARNWWTLFNDPQLTVLEEAATRYNPDVQAAMERVVQARQAASSVESQYYPTISADPSIIRSRSSGAPRGAGGGGGSLSSRSRSVTSNQIQIPFDLAYEVDIWGRVARAVESAQALAQASANDYEVILQTLQADVAQDYFTLRSLDSQVQILSRNVGLYQRQISLLKTRQAAGLLSPTDLAQQQALLEATQATLIETRRQRDDVEHALAVLTGRMPGELSLPENPAMAEPPRIPPGLPAGLLRRRADIAEAEQNLRSANADIGERIAEFYPRVSLTGAAGFESFDLAHAVDWQSRILSFGPSVSIPLFEGGRLSANLAQARARYQELFATYRGAVLTAIGDVEDNLTDLHRRADQEAAQQRAVDASREYFRLSEIQRDQGIIDNLQVIDADRTLLTNELTAAQIRQQRLISTVLLIKSLGGGWQAPPVAFYHPAATMPSASPETLPPPLPVIAVPGTLPATAPATRPAP
jgi:multidrug efflux system outer membrane protein